MENESAYWECPQCGYMNPMGQAKCSWCDYGTYPL